MISIEPSDVGVTGLLWLFVSYGYVLYAASNLISEGSELLLLVPSMAGLVGGVVLPLLGAVPDGAIILFSGLGEKSVAQETLSVGVGALAGSTVMLLTISFGLSILGGRVNIDPETGRANYLGKPKLTKQANCMAELRRTGIAVTDPVRHGAVIMMVTTVPYFLIQVPAAFLHGPTEQVARGEHWWSLAGVIVCLLGLVFYMYLQLQISAEGQDKGKRMAVTKKLLREGMVSLSGAVAACVAEQESRVAVRAATEYQHLTTDAGGGGNHRPDAKENAVAYPPPAIADYLSELLSDAFKSYDKNRNGQLDRNETYVFFRDYHESISERKMERLFARYDTDSSGYISFDEFIGLAYNIIKMQDAKVRMSLTDSAGAAAAAAAATVAAENPAAVTTDTTDDDSTTHENLAAGALDESPEDEEEEQEEIPEDFTSLSPEQQQTAIKKRAFTMLTVGTVLVVVFSDPMVDVMQEIAVRCHLSPFYVSFILAPLASNASEVISSMYYAAKKTRKTITVSLTALEGAACMNNTFCLCIFMFLIYFRGLAWQYSAETIAIVAVQWLAGLAALRETNLRAGTAVVLLLLFPASIVLVVVLEAIGFD